MIDVWSWVAQFVDFLLQILNCVSLFFCKCADLLLFGRLGVHQGNVDVRLEKALLSNGKLNLLIRGFFLVHLVLKVVQVRLKLKILTLTAIKLLLLFRLFSNIRHKPNHISVHLSILQLDCSNSFFNLTLNKILYMRGQHLEDICCYLVWCLQVLLF